MAGVVARREIMDSITANQISTFGGNPLSTAGALANLAFMLDNDLQTNTYKVGAQLKADLDAMAHEIPEILEVRGKGLMLGFELGDPDTLAPDPALATRILEETKKEALLVGKGGLHGNVIRMAPPMTLTADEATEGFAKLDAAVRRAVE